MAKTRIRPDQARTLEAFDDQKAAGSGLEDPTFSLEVFLQGVLSQVNRVIHTTVAGEDWHADLAVPSGFENGAKRGVNALGQSLHNLERKRLLTLQCTMVDVAVPAGQNTVILGAGELPANQTAAVGAVTTLGTIVAAHTGTFGDHSLDAVAGQSGVKPKNIVPIVAAGTRDPILSSNRRVYALIQSENATDGHTIIQSTPNRVQLSFVVVDSAGTGLEACPVPDIENLSLQYCYVERVGLQDASEQVLLPGALFDEPVGGGGGGGVPVTRTLIAGAGLTGGGNLTADRTFNVGANADGSIVVNADDVQVGVLATDAQHGNRGGGSQHALAVALGDAGFMSGADKNKLDGIEPGAVADGAAGDAHALILAGNPHGTTAVDVGAAPSSHVGTGGVAEHPLAVALGAAGFLSGADKDKLDSVEANADVTDSANVAAAGAIMDSDIAEAEGFMRKTSAGAYEAIKTNLNASVDPNGATDDVTLGYEVGSRWINTTLDKEFVCLDNADGAAVWVETTQTGGGGVPTSRNLTAGAGLTGGGDLSADRTFDVVANPDGSIVVNANDVQVGVLASDAQHGSRGGGSQHALAIALGAAGFMSGADKDKLDNVASGATNTPLSDTDPVNVTKSVASEGVATEAARQDHKHDVDTAAPAVNAVVPGQLQSEGTATSLSRSDHVHAVAAATPTTIGTANQAGSANSFVRSDHVHAHGNQTSGTLHAVAIALGANGFMSGADKDKLDNIEALADVTDSTNVAAAGAVMDSDFAGSFAGFMHRTGAGAYEALKSNLSATTDPTATDDSGSDYTVGSRWINTTLDKEFVCLDATAAAAVWTETTVTGGGVPTSRNLTAGAGLTGGGDLSADRTFDVVANPDGSIVVNANDVQVGVLASDAQHGSRGGGSQHALAIALGAAGFMSGADKDKLDNIATGATNTPLSDTDPVNVTKSAAAEGVATEAARQDHKHDVDTAAAIELTDATNGEGTSTSLARADHTHAHGDRGGGSLHALAIALGANGFMSGVDKDKLDGIAAGAVAEGAAGDTHAAIVTGNPHNLDAADVGAAPSSHVGAGGVAHANAVAAGAAGFMTGADKDKLDNIEALADVTDSTNVAAAGAIMDSDISEAEGFMRKTGAGAYEAIKTNLAATTDPTTGDDSGDGYAVGSRWINVTLDKEFVCLDATAAAAVWTETTGGGSGGGDVSGPGVAVEDSSAVVWDGTSGTDVKEANLKTGTSTAGTGTRTLGADATLCGGYIGNATHSINATGTGAVAIGGSDGISGVGSITASGTGSITLVGCSAIPVGATATADNSGTGSLLLGYILQGASGTGLMSCAGIGSVVQGLINNTGTLACTTGSDGCFVQGYAEANGTIQAATGEGQFVQGFANGASSLLEGTTAGVFVHGYAASGASVRGTNLGAVAIGTGFGGAAILASGLGSFAGGFGSGSNVTASGTASFAFGNAVGGNVIASGSGSIQFGIGTNAIGVSLKIGNDTLGIRLRGDNSTATPRIGDFRCDGTHVYVYGGTSPSWVQLT